MAVDTERLMVALAMLFVFGIGYNALVAWVYRQAPDHGYTAFLVAGGVIATLAGFAFLASLEMTMLILACFAASGLPVIIGSVLRQLQQRARVARALEEQALEAIRAN